MSRAPRHLLIGLACALSALAVPACSAIVAPDTTRLGGSDAGPPEPDTGPTPDVGVGVDGGGSCGGPAACDDGIACTIDACVAGACNHGADDTRCGPGERCNPGSGCVPIACTTDADCADGNACNGDERCAPGTPGADPTTGCTSGGPVSCDDGIGCTIDACDPASGCTHTADLAACDDGIGCTIDACTGLGGPSGCEHTVSDAVCATDPCLMGSSCSATSGCVGGTPRDCREGDPCTADTCDATVPGYCVHTPVDADGDGAPARTVGGATCAGGTDCNDGNPAVHPGATEICGNGIDDDCNGLIDDGCTTSTGEDCTSAIPLTLTGDPAATRTARFDGVFANYTDDYAACRSSGGRDAVFSLAIDRLSDVRIETTARNIDTVLGVSTGICDPGIFGLACNDDADPGNSNLGSRIWVHRVAPTGAGATTIYILVDGWDASITGNFQLDVTVTPAADDRCGVTQLDITPGGLVVGSLGGLSSIVGGQRGSCDPDFIDTDVEAVFRLTGPGDGQIWSLQAFAPGFAPMLYVRTGSCGGPGSSEITCTNGGCGGGGCGAQLTNVRINSGTRAWVFLDGAPSGSTTPMPYGLVYDP